MKKNLWVFRIKKSEIRKLVATVWLSLLVAQTLLAQSNPNPDTSRWYASAGIIGTLVLITIVILVAIVILAARFSNLLTSADERQEERRNRVLRDELAGLKAEDIDDILEKRKAALLYKLKGSELGSDSIATDSRGIVANLSIDHANPYVDEKKKLFHKTVRVPQPLKKIVIAYIAASVCWLIFGTLVGQYVGMKFVWPEMDNQSWLSFGRLRAVHTNTVFWGWASLAMIGLAYFVVARTSNARIHSYRWAWLAWVLINVSVLVGNTALMAGINNGGGEYREYIWPVAVLFALGLLLTLVNFYRTIAVRKVADIYISNWYLLGGLIWTLTLVTIGYLPNFQDGLGETVIQGYYMHQGVGMWFMTFTLGLVYYYLPSSLNKPIYSYSLGVLAFWTQMLFYTMIGTHHFVFSPLPWWLQTVAIVFSAGMFIPVIAGSTNFLMTMRGSWNEISKSYVLPFFLVGVVFYFVGSAQGSFQAFRFTNYVWHFTDFNVAHSHMTMYGIITFILWACIYAIVPRITGREPKQAFVGVHFWLAFVGLFAYMISLMAGGTLKGLSWIAGDVFIESVILMKPYWVWRGVGGSLMFLSHIMFAYNFYVMVKGAETTVEPVVAETAPSVNDNEYAELT